jgi:hypothetical protein
LDGKFHGRGTFTYLGGNTYTGDYKDENRTGWGVYIFTNGNKYEGLFLNGKFHGQGTFIYSE